MGEPVAYRDERGRLVKEFVGHQPTETDDDKVACCIFETDGGPFLVATLQRGVKRGDPIMVGNKISEMVLFD